MVKQPEKSEVGEKRLSNPFERKEVAAMGPLNAMGH